MVRFLVLFMGLVVLSACGKAPDQQVLDVAPEFTSYVTRFQQSAAQVGSPLAVTNLRIQFGQMENPQERGLCDVSSLESVPTILIDKAGWSQMDDASREEVLFHELGHCVLRRKHNAGLTKGLPVSMMNPYTIGDGVYLSQHDYYLRELFATRNEF